MRFYPSLLIYSIIVFAGFYFAEPHLPAKVIFAPFIWIQVVMVMATVAVHSGLSRASAKSGQAFVRFFMGATSLKLLLFMILIIGYGLLNRDTATAFIIHFFLFYLFYTVFEVYFAYKQFGPALRKK